MVLKLIMVDPGINLHNVKNWILTHKVAIVIAFIGAIVGYFYWNFIGCASGNCGITANWYTSIAFGLIIGWLIGDMANDKIQNKKKTIN